MIPKIAVYSLVGVLCLATITSAFRAGAQDTSRPFYRVHFVALDPVSSIEDSGGWERGASRLNDDGYVIYNEKTDGGIAGILWHSGISTRIKCPGAGKTIVFGINNRRSVVGTCTSASSSGAVERGFVYTSGKMS